MSYAPDRVRQLRILLWMAIGGALLLVVAAALLPLGGADPLGSLVAFALPGLLLLGLAAAAQTQLGPGTAAARPLTAATGVLAVLVALWLSATGVGLLFALVGVPLLLIAVLPGRDAG